MANADGARWGTALNRGFNAVVGRRQLVWLDLCAGLGGASQPALDRGWRVIRVDIEPRFKRDVVADVRNLPLKPFHIDVLWASPPCQQFSKQGMRCFFPDPPEPDLSISIGVYEAIEYWRPRFWVVENVWAARPWLTKLFGPVRAMPPGHALWSNLGFLLPSLRAHKGNFNAKRLKGRWGHLSGLHSSKSKARQEDTAAAATVPYEIGTAICRAVEARQ